MLDIGCADGHFLALAKERGWETFGVEISQFFIKKAREKLGESSVFGMPLKMAKFPSDFFDTVTMWDVLDQLLDPLEELQEIKRILKKGGVLVIRVRNMAFHLFVSRMLKKNIFRFIRNLATCHLYGFNRENINALLEKAGFSKIKVINSRLTVGDPYSQIKFMGGSSIVLMKKIYYAFSEFLSFFSGKKILISPSLLIYVQKK